MRPSPIQVATASVFDDADLAEEHRVGLNLAWNSSEHLVSQAHLLVSN